METACVCYMLCPSSCQCISLLWSSGAPGEFDRLVSAEVADYSLANFKSYEDAAGVISGVAATKTPMSDASVGRGRRSGMLSSHKRGRCIWKCSMELSGRQD